MDWEQKIIRFVKEDNKKVIFLVNLRDNLDKMANFLQGFSQLITSPHLIVFFNLEIPKQFVQTKLAVRTSEDYLSKEDYEAIDNYVFEDLSKSWYLYKGITDFHGIPLGKMYEYDFQKYLTPRIKNLEIIQKVIVKENIQKIIVIEDTGELEEVARLYANITNIPILAISIKKSRKLPFNLNLKVRSKFSTFFSMLLDYIAFKGIIKLKDSKGLILIDAKLYRFLQNMDSKLPFAQCPLEKGTGVRLNLIKKGFTYLPLYFTKNRRYSKDWFLYKKIWKNLNLEKDFKDIFKYKGISLWEIVHRQLSVFFLESVPRIISNINMLFEIAKEKNIKTAVLRNDVKELERIIILGLRLAKVPSLVIQHGILAESNGHNVLLADKFAAWGKASVDWYGRFGNSFEKFEVTGNPRFDTLANWKPKLSRQELCRQLNLDVNKGIILFATQQINKFSSFWTDDLFWVIADKLLTATRKFPDKQLVIKVDPYEDVGPYRNRIKESSHNNAVAIRDIDIYSLIFFSELVITLDSTVGIEAMIFDKPLITVNLTKRWDRVPYAEKEAAIGVYEEENLLPAIEKALTDQETISRLKIGRNRFLKEYAYEIDGKADVRLSNFIKHYIEN